MNNKKNKFFMIMLTVTSFTNFVLVSLFMPVLVVPSIFIMILFIIIVADVNYDFKNKENEGSK